MRILVLALGNDLFGDDAVAFLVADEISSSLPEDSVNVIKSSESGLHLLDYFLMGYDHIILVDSIVGEEVGRIVQIDPKSLRRSLAPSPHYSGLPEILALLDEIGEDLPEVEIYAIVIREPSLGSPISDDVKVAAKKLAEILLERISQILRAS
ncbi:hydrogenase maturation protease [Candidatus Korarchaeum cryptofilum]|uniref:Ni,Fe-hydrogenase maturation factor n=1 Tax=Korarchaeum cryptofilum (strain OPF8) TaxID=374847 RepID=B1L5Y7_KORCO|nr:hydrogenase maturation protease [Candidatus Korarchaeum cryptofilum]ACB07866.1 Ni,Fe-hydrogenase maturation factor [Candidatus Korarchaeum cryptofilum OPF8]